MTQPAVRVGKRCPRHSPPIAGYAAGRYARIALRTCARRLQLDAAPFEDLPRPGDRIGPYLVEALLGRGAMGAVYRVRHADTDEQLALKVLADIGLNIDGESDDSLVRFRREAEILARIDAHPGIVRVRNFGVDEGQPWCAMEYVEGSSLAELLRAGPLSPRRAASLLALISRAIDFVHGHGVLHRDLKPANVVIDVEGRPRILDFGLAHDAWAERLTRSGDILGTPSYMAPEQVAPGVGGRAGELGPWTDVYALGSMLYATLTGRPPFAVGNARSVMLDVVSTESRPPSQRNATVSVELDAICLRAIAKEPAHRYPSAAAFAEDLERWLAGARVSAGMSDYLDRVWARLRRPASRASRTAAAAFSALSLAVLCAALLLPFPAGSSRESEMIDRLTILEVQIEADGRVAAPALAEIETLLDAANKGRQDGLVHRLELLRLLAKLGSGADQEGEDAAEVSAAVAGLIRPGGRVDQTLLRRAQRALLQSDRLGVLNEVLHGHEPMAVSSPEVSAALARAMAAGREGLAVPIDDQLFTALLDAPGLTPQTRGQLLLLKGRAVLVRGETFWPKALGCFERALHDFGVPPSAVDWPAGFRDHVREQFLGAFDTDQLRTGKILDLLVRASPRSGELSIALVARLQEMLREVAGSFVLGQGEVDESDMERALLFAAFLEPLGGSPVSDENIEESWGGLRVPWLKARAESEMGRSPSRRNPAILLLLARFLRKLESEDLDRDTRDDLVRAWTMSAAETSLDAAWFNIQVASLLESVDAEGEALPYAERALELHRLRPDEQRWPLVPEIVVDILEDIWDEDDVDDLALERLRRAANLIVEAIRIQRAVEPRLLAIREAGAAEPWPLARRKNIVIELDDLARQFRELEPPRCCGGKGEDATVLDRLLKAGLSAAVEPRARGKLHERRANHHWKHERRRESLEDMDAAVRYQLAHLATTLEPEYVDLGRMPDLLVARASRRQELDRYAEARDDLTAAIAYLEGYPKAARGRRQGRNLAAVFAHRARLNHKRGKLSEAIEDWSKAIDHQSDSSRQRGRGAKKDAEDLVRWRDERVDLLRQLGRSEGARDDDR